MEQANNAHAQQIAALQQQLANLQAQLEHRDDPINGARVQLQQQQKQGAAAVEAQHYTPWTTNMEMIAQGQWATVKHMLKFIGSARLINFSLTE